MAQKPSPKKKPAASKTGQKTTRRTVTDPRKPQAAAEGAAPASGPNEASEKLQKVLARAGLGSRREMEQAISDGRVEVNGLPARLGDRVTAVDHLVFDGRAVSVPGQVRRVLLYNKPEGEVCTRDDPEGRPTVFDRLPPAGQGRWISVGRLDINTSGLLLLTTDGELASRLMHPSSQIEREYAVRVLGDVNPDMVQAMHEGVMLEDGMARFTDIQEFAGSGANTWFHVVIMEGRNREVRRLWESQGVRVSRLKRVRFANVFLDADLRMGQWKELDQATVDELAAQADLPPVPVPDITGKLRDKTERKQRKRSGVGAARKPERQTRRKARLRPSAGNGGKRRVRR